ncbi:lasso peptide biosynthesis B2 protein [Erythrobacter alti]|uniref:lasso peptide biosynthesis B2 protein n=1 Tax=Erythrobacter alti TaxID=1896145 RepID=UPI0030F411D5
MAKLSWHAFTRLVSARLQHEGFQTSDVDKRNSEAAALGRALADARPHDQTMVLHVAWVIPRVAHRMPFRSDCLVQAMAAQDWLLGRGIASRIVIGVVSSEDRPFESHAWLTYGPNVVTGGMVDAFRPILG